jgi:hypothetical protein
VILVNGEPFEAKKENGYAIIERAWKADDVVEYSLPMNVKKVKANELVEEDRGKLALERGPVVFCVEEIDNPLIDSLGISENSQFIVAFNPELLNGVSTLTAQNEGGSKQFTAIPYYAWNNRGANKMKVWLPEK